jgi:hypothetical protein
MTRPPQSQLELDDAPVWERRHDEPGRAYAAFSAYRDLGPKRTLRDALRAWRAEKPEQKGARWSAVRDLRSGVPGTWERWRREYEWETRAAAFDRHGAAIERTAWETAQRDAAEKKARRRLEYEEATYTDLARINQRVAAILAEDAPLGRLRIVKETDKGTQTKELDRLREFQQLSEERRRLAAEYFGSAGDTEPDQAAAPPGPIGIRFQLSPDLLEKARQKYGIELDEWGAIRLDECGRIIEAQAPNGAAAPFDEDKNGRRD